MRTTNAQISQCICAADQCLCNSLPRKNDGSKCYLEISIFWLGFVAEQTGLRPLRSVNRFSGIKGQL